MKKVIFMMMLIVGSLSFAGQAGVEEYRYTQRGISMTENAGNLSYSKGQAGYSEYNYTQKDYSSALLRDSGMNKRMSRSSIAHTPYITGQPGYDLYRYNQNGSTLR